MTVETLIIIAAGIILINVVATLVRYEREAKATTIQPLVEQKKTRKKK